VAFVDAIDPRRVLPLDRFARRPSTASFAGRPEDTGLFSQSIFQ
jgi:hypothetical protein